MALATLSIDLEARLAKLEEGLTKAGRMSEKAANQIEKDFAKNRKIAENLGAAIGAAFSAETMRQWFMATVDGLDALNDLKDATGASIENISALEDVAARTGTSFESVSSTLVKFNKVLGESKAGSETANILKAIGLNAEELKKIDPAEALRQTAVALANFSDDASKARVVQALFGKSVQEAAPFLKDLAEQTTLVGKVTAEQAQAAEDFNKQLFQLQKNAKDTARALIGDLLPALNNIFDRSKSEGGFFGALGTDLLSGRAKSVAAELKQVTSEYEKLATTQKELQAGGKDLNAFQSARLKDLRDEIQSLTQQATDLNSRVKARLGQPMADGLPSASYSNEGRKKTLTSIGDIPDKDAKAKASELQKYIEQLEKAQLASLDLSEEDKARIAITNGELGRLTKSQEDYVIALAKGIDLSKQKETRFVDTSALDAEIALQKELNSVIENTPLAKMQRTVQLEKALAEAFKNGTHGFDGSTEAAQRYQEALAALHPEIEKVKDESNEFAKEAAANIQDSLGETLKRSMKGDFDSIEQLWKDMLFNMVAQAAATKLNKALFGDFGSTGNVGGLLGLLFSGGGGGASYPTIGGGVGDIAGYIIPSAAGIQSASGGRMSAQRTVVIDMSGANYQIGADVSRGDVIKAIDQRNAQLEDKIRRAARQGSLA